MKRLLSMLLALALASPVLAAEVPLVIQSGQVKRLPAATTLQLNAPTIGSATINLPHGAAPSSPANGDCWTTTAGLYCRISGVTVGPYAIQSGTVTSVQASGGTTGLSFSGGPITNSGTLTLSGTLAIANGGTGGATQATARSGLGLAIGSDVQAYSAKLAAYAGGDTPSAFTLGIVDAVDAAAWRTAIGAGTSSTTGTVTSVSGSGGTTGLTLSGGPITGSGTLTLGGTLAVANGGTGAATLGSGYLVKGNGTSALSASPVYIDGSDRVLIGTNVVSTASFANEVHAGSAGAWPLALTAVDRGLLIRASANTSGYYAYFEYNGGTNNGSISWSGATTSFNTSSDERLKRDITDADESGSVIDALRVRQFNWRADGVHVRYGGIAQEMVKVYPEAILSPADPAASWAVDWSKFVPLLIKEVQALRARVAKLEDRP